MPFASTLRMFAQNFQFSGYDIVDGFWKLFLKKILFVTNLLQIISFVFVCYNKLTLDGLKKFHLKTMLAKKAWP